MIFINWTTVISSEPSGWNLSIDCERISPSMIGHAVKFARFWINGDIIRDRGG